MLRLEKIITGVGISKGRKCLRCRKCIVSIPTTINIYDLEIRSINNYRNSYNIASFLVSRRFLVDADSVTRNLVNIYVPRMCVVTAFTIIIGYLQTFTPTIIADFSRKWPTIYDNH